MHYCLFWVSHWVDGFTGLNNWVDPAQVDLIRQIAGQRPILAASNVAQRLDIAFNATPPSGVSAQVRHLHAASRVIFLEGEISKGSCY
jgi:hypothetical protein